ncbi:Store-operated calcium entry-associated regulatory factor, partial [Chytridiales sp. JEL 0842]
MTKKRSPPILLLLVALSLTLSLIIPSVSASPHKKVLLEDVKVLTLYKGRMTTARRSSPVPQMSCVGGDACKAAKDSIETMQCYNVGFDGRDVQWECKAELEDLYKFGRTDVSCEGYANPNDKYILAGSCGVEYTLYYTQKGLRNKNKKKNYYYSDDGMMDDETEGGSGVLGKIVWMLVAGVFLYSMWNSCMQAIARGDGGRGPNGSRGSSSSSGGGPNNGGGGGGGPGFGPGNNGGGGGNNCDPPLNSNAGGTRPGFWSGFTWGGLLGSLLAPRRQGYGYGYGNPYAGYGYGGGWGGGGYGGYRRTGGGGGSSSMSSGSS